MTSNIAEINLLVRISPGRKFEKKSKYVYHPLQKAICIPSPFIPIIPPTKIYTYFIHFYTYTPSQKAIHLPPATKAMPILPLSFEWSLIFKNGLAIKMPIWGHILSLYYSLIGIGTWFQDENNLHKVDFGLLARLSWILLSAWWASQQLGQGCRESMGMLGTWLCSSWHRWSSPSTDVMLG